jgi:hypothetical protein
VIAFGQVRHMFHGDYSMIVGIVFKTPDEAKRALPLFPGFAIQDKALVRLARGRKSGEPHDTRTEVDDVKTLIERWRVYPNGAHRGEIDGCPFSIDTGPLFHMHLTQALIDHHDAQRQLQLQL